MLDNSLVDDQFRAALAGNDPAAVELIWNRYANDLLAFLRAVLCSSHDAEDVLQSVFVRIVRSRHKLARARRLDAYVYRMARNEAATFLGRRKRDQAAQHLSDWLDESDRSDRPAHGGDQESDLAEELRAALEQLPQPQREVIVMKIYRQKTFLEIARLLGLSANTAASRYRYGMEKLRTLVGEISL